MNYVIQVEGLHKYYQKHFWAPRVAVLKGLDLKIEPGQVFGFLGPNGAGKTTTIKTLMGIIKPSKGKVEIFGQDPWGTAPKQRTGFLPESPYFYEYLTGREFLRFCGKLYDLKTSGLENKISDLLSLVKMTDSADRQMRKYSKGMLQRIGLAQSLISDPELVVLDEPLTGLDPLGRKEFKDIILNLKAQGKTVFFSSHILPDAEMVCDQVAIINKGKLLKSGSLAELLNARIKSVEFTCRNITEEDAGKLKNASLSANMVDGQWQFNLKTEDDISGAINLVKTGEGDIISIIPQKESLEEYFSREVAKDE